MRPLFLFPSRLAGPRHQVLGAAGAGGHPLDVIEVDVLHQLLAGRAGRIHATRCSAPPAPMGIPWT
ncbi:hypothetical protein ABDG97_29725 [Pseudomonas aeruginosa]|uniref:hypothetical protein n=1 Tax=Pseudomonas aeruginosa TaxID=287 RepID=UPI00128EAF4B|nr:hypothetical protein [Pseudomonas aeruginosa]MBG5567816.1 hypothetical protein [Pseudomonas aeruginosa]